MGGKYTEAQKKASKDYISKLDNIQLRTIKGTKDRWKAEAEKRDKSLNQFVIDCVENEVKKGERTND